MRTAWLLTLVMAQGGSALDPAYLDQLLAPVALYPDPLLAQMLLLLRRRRARSPSSPRG